MPFVKWHPADATPGHVFTTHPEIHFAWAEMSQALMNGPSPLSQGERELILAYAAGVTGCRFVLVAHSEVACAWGIERGLVERLVDDPETPVEPRLRPLLAFVGKLATTPGALAQADADAVFAAGWDEEALHHAIAIAARAAFMQRLAEGQSFVPISREVAARQARRRVEQGYVDLYPAFRKEA